MFVRIESQILNSGHCFRCKKCCKFDADELEDAPTFTEAQFHRATQEFGIGFSGFEKIGDLYKVILVDIPGSAKKVCPFYEQDSGNCRVFKYEIFDCYTWPFYLMRLNDKVLVTFSVDCPVVSNFALSGLVEYARKKIGPQMMEMARQHPDLITDLHGNVKVLCDVKEFDN